MTTPVLVLWDIARTLLYAGETDRLVYREVFTDLVGRPPERLPAKGTGRTVPLAVKELFATNGIAEADRFTEIAIRDIPRLQADHFDHMRAHGFVLPGAHAALAAVQAMPGVTATVVTGNLQPSAELKLRAFELDGFVDSAVGGYSSDDPHRPALVAVAQARASDATGDIFDRTNTVIIGDSLEDVTTGREGGASVIAIASGTTSAETLAAAGADVVLPDLCDPEAVCSGIVQRVR
ncbi:HAD family hydrolase [Nocardiopsis coralliicola]